MCPIESDNKALKLPILSSLIDETTGRTGVSVFTEQSLSLDDYNGLFITPRIDALNFRHRFSEANSEFNRRPYQIVRG